MMGGFWPGAWGVGVLMPNAVAPATEPLFGQVGWQP